MLNRNLASTLGCIRVIGELEAMLYVVLDFDRPRRGVILVDQAPLVELREFLRRP